MRNLPDCFSRPPPPPSSSSLFLAFPYFPRFNIKHCERASVVVCVYPYYITTKITPSLSLGYFLAKRQTHQKEKERKKRKATIKINQHIL
jgi:hypothetical protein